MRLNWKGVNLKYKTIVIIQLAFNEAQCIEFEVKIIFDNITCICQKDIKVTPDVEKLYGTMMDVLQELDEVLSFDLFSVINLHNIHQGFAQVLLMPESFYSYESEGSIDG